MSSKDGLSTSGDHIRIHGLSFSLPLQESAWSVDVTSKGVLQPVRVSLDVALDLSETGSSDNLTSSVDYSHISTVVQNICSESKRVWSTGVRAYDLANEIVDACFSATHRDVECISVELELPKAILLAESCGIKISRRCNSEKSQDDVFFIHRLPLTTIIGVLPHERKRKQPLIINLFFKNANGKKRLQEYSRRFDPGGIEQLISDFVQASSFHTLEALTSAVVDECLEFLGDQKWLVTAAICKPAALTMAAAPEVVLSRSRSPFPQTPLSDSSSTRSRSSSTRTVVALALGANVGDRFRNIELALRYLENPEPILVEVRKNLDNMEGDLRVVETSFLYETSPMYVVNQPSFINCACLLETTFSALDILRIAKAIENRVGRQKSERFGPRAVDVDVISFGIEIIDTRPEGKRDSLDNLEGQLVVPHPRLQEREFVLRPLHDLMPRWAHPSTGLTVDTMLRKLVARKSENEAPMLKVIPFSNALTLKEDGTPYDVPSTLSYWTLRNSAVHNSSSIRQGKATLIMGTLNATPDSFSDGGKHLSLVDALKYAEDAIRDGVDIIDIGGYSTRPGAAVVSTEDEISRVVPIIKAIRASDNELLKCVLISIDTFRWEVAEAAILAGANVINDVYAFSGPQYPTTPTTEAAYSEMKRIARKTNVPVIMMHSRGDAGSNKDYSLFTAFGPSKGGKTVVPVLQAIKLELGTKVMKATEGSGCLRRWQVIVDPGIGFSKSEADNLAILRHAHDLVDVEQSGNPLAGYPLLIGASRKSFLGSVIARSKGNAEVASRPASERDFATAAAVACAVQQKVDILRVHNVRGMVDAVKVSEAIWN
ncbi:Dihydropteroate synthase [Schizopora paradoxa]|uniref:Dihydropteroate synthase n=1 Tax=Schizopora paradoxa TaxID=27342 RepID=A0A0H2R7I4_9AGAM|nr:Dihydropteroate synthase [Schizopora paradoxa]